MGQIEFTKLSTCLDFKIKKKKYPQPGILGQNNKSYKRENLRLWSGTMMGQESRIPSLGDWSVSGAQRSKTAGKHRVNLYLFIWICKIPWGRENRYDMNALMKWNMRPDLWINIRNKNILKCILVLGHLLCLAANSRFAQSHGCVGLASAWDAHCTAPGLRASSSSFLAQSWSSYKHCLCKLYRKRLPPIWTQIVQLCH